MRLQPKVMSLGIGAGAMYLLDPEQGKRRRALVRDRMVHLGHVTTTAASKRARDLRNRTRGVTHGLVSHLHRDRADDVVLHDRVRSQLGHLCSHPSAIEVTCEDGCCTLSGPILASERDRLLAAISKLRGVVEVVDELSLHDDALDGPVLQGGAIAGSEPDLLQEHRSPATRALVGVIGSSLVVAGAGLLLRNLRGRAARHLAGPDGRGVHLAARADGPCPPEGLPLDGDSLMLDGGEPLAGPQPGSTANH